MRARNARLGRRVLIQQPCEARLEHRRDRPTVRRRGRTGCAPVLKMAARAPPPLSAPSPKRCSLRPVRFQPDPRAPADCPAQVRGRGGTRPAQGRSGPQPAASQLVRRGFLYLPGMRPTGSETPPRRHSTADAPGRDSPDRSARRRLATWRHSEPFPTLRQLSQRSHALPANRLHRSVQPPTR